MSFVHFKLISVHSTPPLRDLHVWAKACTGQFHCVRASHGVLSFLRSRRCTLNCGQSKPPRALRVRLQAIERPPASHVSDGTCDQLTGGVGRSLRQFASAQWTASWSRPPAGATKVLVSSLMRLAAPQIAVILAPESGATRCPHGRQWRARVRRRSAAPDPDTWDETCAMAVPRCWATRRCRTYIIASTSAGPAVRKVELVIGHRDGTTIRETASASRRIPPPHGAPAASRNNRARIVQRRGWSGSGWDVCQPMPRRRPRSNEDHTGHVPVPSFSTAMPRMRAPPSRSPGPVHGDRGRLGQVPGRRHHSLGPAAVLQAPASADGQTHCSGSASAHVAEGLGHEASRAPPQLNADGRRRSRAPLLGSRLLPQISCNLRRPPRMHAVSSTRAKRDFVVRRPAPVRQQRSPRHFEFFPRDPEMGVANASPCVHRNWRGLRDCCRFTVAGRTLVRKFDAVRPFARTGTMAARCDGGVATTGPDRWTIVSSRDDFQPARRSGGPAFGNGVKHETLPLVVIYAGNATRAIVGTRTN